MGLTQDLERVNVRHDATVLLTLRAGPEDQRAIVEQREVPVTLLGGAITTMSIIYNARAVSGGVEWRNPRTGEYLIRPKYDYELTDPDNQILPEGTLCDCKDVCNGGA